MNLTPQMVEELPTEAKKGDLVLIVVRWASDEAAAVFVGGYDFDPESGDVILATGTDFEAFDMQEVEATYVLPADQFETDEDYQKVGDDFAIYLFDTGQDL